MAKASGKKPTGRGSSGTAGTNNQSKGSDIAAAGDNRRLGDADGNKTGGASKSRGAKEATDDADEDASKGA